MEMTDILSVPLKKTSEIDLVKPLKNLIALRFSTADNPENFNDAISELNKLRSLACVRAMDKNEAAIETVARYCDQLAALEGKIPAQDVQIPFKWKDAFDKGSLFSGKMSLTINSLSYERMCCLFNLAAFQSQVAAVQSQESDEGLKLAAKLLQSASGVFSYLKANVMGALQQEPTPDLNPEILATLSSLMLAEAQEIFVIKAISDKMKEAIIAKLASQCDEFYAETLKQMKHPTATSVWEKDWISKVTGKQLAYHAIAQYYQSRVCNGKKAIGEEIARLQDAIENFKAAQQRISEATAYQDYVNRAQKALTEAQKDNDFIYHERVPDVKILDPVGKAPLAKTLPIPERLGASFKDLFEGLTPVVVHQAMAAWDVRKTEIINVEVGRMREANQMLNGTLASLNLPAALEESAGESLPQSLKDKARAVRQSGGIDIIKELIGNLPSLLERNKEILDEAERLLNEERQSDDQLKAQFKERWSRTPSVKLTEAFTSNIAKYRQILANASNADNVVKGKFESHRRGIELLSRPEGELETAVPSASQSAADNSRSPAAAQLRLLMSQVNALKSEREVLEHELKNATIDMKQQFLGALAQDGAINEPAVSVEKLGQVYGPLQKRIRESIDFQASLIQQIQTVNEDFVKDKSDGKGPSAREELLKELATAHDIHMEVQNNLQEGAKFYNDLTQLLLSFQSKISDFCFARKAEKEELLKDLTSSYAGNASSNAPPSEVPSYHATQAREAPARPPPPNFGTSAPTSSAPAAHLTTSPSPMAPQVVPGQTGPAPNHYLPYPIQPYGGMPMPMPMPMSYGYPSGGAPPNYDYANQAQYQQQQHQQSQQPQQQGAPGYPGYNAYPYPYYNPAYPYTPPRPY